MRLPRVEYVDVEKFDLTAMIDIVLLLIIFFTFTAQFAAATRAPMDLPRERGERDVAPAPRTVFVDLGANGSLKALDAPVTREQLITLVQAEQTKAGPNGVFDLVIRADRTGPALHLNRLAAALSSAAIRRWRLATSGEGEGPAEGGGG